MRLSKKHGRAWRAGAAGLALATMLSATGCQVDVGGQTLPSPYYMGDDVQYFPAGPEFKLSQEAAAMKARAAEERLEGGPVGQPF